MLIGHFGPKIRCIFSFSIDLDLKANPCVRSSMGREVGKQTIHRCHKNGTISFGKDHVIDLSYYYHLHLLEEDIEAQRV